MKINKVKNGTELTISLEGRLDTMTAPILEAEVQSLDGDIDMIVFDLEGLEYVSSAGLRVILMFQKLMKQKNGMVIKHVNAVIMEVFEVTGFVGILTIE